MAKILKRIFFLIVLSSALLILYVQITKYNNLIVTNSSLVYITENEEQETFYTDKHSGSRIQLPDNGYTQIYPSRNQLEVQYLINNLGFVELTDGKIETYYSDLTNYQQIEDYGDLHGSNNALFEGTYEQDGVMHLYSVYLLGDDSYLRTFNTKTKEIDEITIEGELHTIYYNPVKEEFDYVSKVDQWLNSLKVYKGKLDVSSGITDKPQKVFAIPGYENVQITAVATDKGIACITCGQAEQYITNYIEKDGKIEQTDRKKLSQKYEFYEQIASLNYSVLLKGEEYVGFYNSKNGKGTYVSAKTFDGTTAYQLNNGSFTYVEKNKVLTQNTIIKMSAQNKEVEKITVPVPIGETITAFNLPE